MIQGNYSVKLFQVNSINFVSMFVHQHNQKFSFYFLEVFFHRPVILFN